MRCRPFFRLSRSSLPISPRRDIQLCLTAGKVCYVEGLGLERDWLLLWAASRCLLSLTWIQLGQMVDGGGRQRGKQTKQRRRKQIQGVRRGQE
ncbi:hypothetical protein BDW60DRAFT_53357 [Aspergillus nidulans var. acristatus]